jgi:hypothetical protein
VRTSDDTALRLQKELLGLDHEDWGLVYMLSSNLTFNSSGNNCRHWNQVIRASMVKWR